MASPTPVSDLSYVDKRVIAVSLWLVLYKTKLGAAVPPVDDRETVSALGVNIDRIYSLIFALSALLVGLAGVLGGYYLQLSPGGDTTILTYSLVIVILGGMGSLLGTVVSSLILGQLLSFGLAYAPQYSYFLMFVPMAIVLAVVPRVSSGEKYECDQEGSAAACFRRCRCRVFDPAAVLCRRITVTTFVRIIYFGFLASSVGVLINQAGIVSLTQSAFLAWPAT